MENFTEKKTNGSKHVYISYSDHGKGYIKKEDGGFGINHGTSSYLKKLKKKNPESEILLAFLSKESIQEIEEDINRQNYFNKFKGHTTYTSSRGIFEKFSYEVFSFEIKDNSLSNEEEIYINYLGKQTIENTLNGLDENSQVFVRAHCAKDSDSLDFKIKSNGEENKYYYGIYCGTLSSIIGPYLPSNSTLNLISCEAGLGTNTDSTENPCNSLAYRLTNQIFDDFKTTPNIIARTIPIKITPTGRKLPCFIGFFDKIPHHGENTKLIFKVQKEKEVEDKSHHLIISDCYTGNTCYIIDSKNKIIFSYKTEEEKREQEEKGNTKCTIM